MPDLLESRAMAGHGVHVDPGTGKHTILGVFSAIRGRQFPLTHPFMIWFLTLTGTTITLDADLA